MMLFHVCEGHDMDRILKVLPLQACHTSELLCLSVPARVDLLLQAGSKHAIGGQGCTKRPAAVCTFLVKTLASCIVMAMMCTMRQLMC